MKTISKKKQKNFAMQMGVYPTGKPEKVPVEKKLAPDGPSAIQMKNIRERLRTEEVSLMAYRTEANVWKLALLEKQAELFEIIVDFHRIERASNTNNEIGDCEKKVAEFLRDRNAIYDKYFPSLRNNNNIVENLQTRVAEKKESYEKLLTELTPERGSRIAETVLEFKYIQLELTESELKQEEEKCRIEMLQEMNLLVHRSTCKIIDAMRVLLKKNGRKNIAFLPGFAYLLSMASHPDPVPFEIRSCRYERKGKKIRTRSKPQKSTSEQK